MAIVKLSTASPACVVRIQTPINAHDLLSWLATPGQDQHCSGALYTQDGTDNKKQSRTYMALPDVRQEFVSNSCCNACASPVMCMQAQAGGGAGGLHRPGVGQQHEGQRGAGAAAPHAAGPGGPCFPGATPHAELFDKCACWEQSFCNTGCRSWRSLLPRYIPKSLYVGQGCGSGLETQ